MKSVLIKNNKSVKNEEMPTGAFQRVTARLLKEDSSENGLRRSLRNSRKQLRMANNKKQKDSQQSESIEENSISGSHNEERNEGEDLQPNPFK